MEHPYENDIDKYMIYNEGWAAAREHFYRMLSDLSKEINDPWKMGVAYAAIQVHDDRS